MLPVLIRIGPVALHSYGVLAAAGFLAGLTVAVRLAPRYGFPDRLVSGMAGIGLAAGLLGGRLLYVLAHPSEFSSFWEIAAIWEGGLMWHGGLILGVSAAGLYARKKAPGKLPAACDLGAVGLCIGQAFGRIGCFLAGCCYGVASKILPVRFLSADSLVPLHLRGVGLFPSQLLESALLFGLAGVLARFARPPAGRAALLYIGVASGIRFGLEFLRADDRGPIWAGLTLTQWISLALIGTAGLLWLMRSRGRVGAAIP